MQPACIHFEDALHPNDDVVVSIADTPIKYLDLFFSFYFPSIQELCNYFFCMNQNQHFQ